MRRRSRLYNCSKGIKTLFDSLGRTGMARVACRQRYDWFYKIDERVTLCCKRYEL